MAAALAVLAMLGAAGSARAALSFSTAPNIGTLTGITLNGGSQTTTTSWATAWAVTDSTGGTGWNVTVNGASGVGKSAVFKQYCPLASCGTDSGPGYVTGGYTLSANSLTVNTALQGWTTAGTKPTFQCNVSACNVDSASAVKIVSASASVASGTWTTNGSSTLTLSTPSTLRKLQTSEVYRIDLLWTLNSGP